MADPVLDCWKLDLDERKMIWQLLDRLSPDERIAFTRWCCQQPSRPIPVDVQKSTSGKTSEAWADICLLAVQYNLDLGKAVVELERRVRKRR